MVLVLQRLTMREVVVKPTCATSGKKHFGKCLVGTTWCFGCGNDDHKVRDCPTIAARGREAKQVAPNERMVVLQRGFASISKGTKLDTDDNAGKL